MLARPFRKHFPTPAGRRTPEGQRAEVVSSYMVACFVGNSIPVIGVGVMTTVWNALLASIVFAGFIGVFAVAAIIVGVRYIPKQPRWG